MAWTAVILVLTSWPSPTVSIQVTGADKVAHFGVYGILGWLVGRAMLVPRTHRMILIALVGLASFGALDELHQLLVPNRETTLADWLADLIGASLGLLTYHLTPRSTPTSPAGAA